MSTTPCVSVCIPAYRQPESLRRTLRSILEQNYGDFEVVLTDDSPDDGVESVVREVGDSRFHYQRNERRLGSPENWNAALSLARGEWIKMMHHDDWFADATSLGDFVALARSEPDVDFAFSPSIACDGDGREVFTHRPREDQLARLRRDPRTLFFGNFVGAPSATIFRRAIHEAFDPRLKWLVDIDHYMRILARARNWVAGTRPLVRIGMGAGRVTKDSFGNRTVEVFEWMWLYRKLRTGPLSWRRLRSVEARLARHGVGSRAELSACGVDFRPPWEVVLLMTLRKAAALLTRQSEQGERERY